MMFVFPGWDTLVFLVWLIQIPRLESVFAPKFMILCGNSRIFNNKTYSFKKNISYPRRYPQQQSQIPISIKWFDQFYSTSVLGLSIALGFPCCLITQWTKRTKITSLGCCWGGGSVSGECFNKNATNLELGWFQKKSTAFIEIRCHSLSTKILLVLFIFRYPHIWQTFGEKRVTSPSDATAQAKCKQASGGYIFWSNIKDLVFRNVFSQSSCGGSWITFQTQSSTQIRNVFRLSLVLKMTLDDRLELQRDPCLLEPNLQLGNMQLEWRLFGAWKEGIWNPKFLYICFTTGRVGS